MSATIIHGDCIEEMSKMDANSIDLTVTSPPYDNLRTYEGSLQWHEGIWKQVIKQLYRVTKDGGVVIWVVGDATIQCSETGTSFEQALYGKTVGFNLHDTMIFKKETPTWNISSKRYRQHLEYMFVFSKGRVTTFNPIEDQQVKNLKPRMCKSNRNGKPRYELYTPKKTHTCRGNIWTYTVGGKSLNHPAVFPEKLAHDHILSWSNQGDTVFDPFLGSGTTGVASIKLNRNFIGIEKVKQYFDLSNERINNVQPELITN